MLNQEQLSKLKAGAEEWNQWRLRTDDAHISLQNADLNGIHLENVNLSNVDLRQADFRGANLEGANLTEANLNRACFNGANLSNAVLEQAPIHEAEFIGSRLDKAIFCNSYLVKADFSNASLRGADFSQASLQRSIFSNADLHHSCFKEADLIYSQMRSASLVDANLQGANLQGANLSETDCDGANFSWSILKDANLTRATLLGANFTEANFTGACLQDWHVNNSTNVERTCAAYFYTESSLDPETGEATYSERRPYDGTFGPDEFSVLLQKSFDTVDLIFKDGIDWQAFFETFQQLNMQYQENKISIQTIECKGRNFVIKIKADADSERKGAIAASAKEIYIQNTKRLEAQIENYEKLIEAEKQEKSALMRFMETMAEKQSSKYDLRGANVGSLVDTAQSGSRVQAILHNYAPEKRESLATAANEIQELLDQLSKSYPGTEVPMQAVAQIQANPKMMERIVGALRGGGKAAIEELVDHPALSIVLAAIEGASNPT
ncbi:pentapeptide repeat-containing protein [cf. Phormidesmis sp. LEGE 11477]|uniref:pentapeptide repeat-containing protein n=1 Tax=cf. Phormidesmis sp. LEGE 11477 TaxID=1828680 RepID=UPI001880DE3E|nr:pentapeptide repeat-containing protein [cf. Phormidesmis sp. LEGE 11477]MBE9064099.1 pentapeptide repeat-containing protein [cf. Phormidesmis sp. LEGE 11477]